MVICKSLFVHFVMIIYSRSSWYNQFPILAYNSALETIDYYVLGSEAHVFFIKTYVCTSNHMH